MTISQLTTLKTQIMTYTRALVYHGLHDSLVERIKHKASNMPTCLHSYPKEALCNKSLHTVE